MNENLDECWGELVTTALLGTDRRPVPQPPAGPVADVVADLGIVVGDGEPETRFLNQVATITLARRLAAQPGPAVPPLAPPELDRRPLCSPAAAASWRRLVEEWPLLEDEWLAVAMAKDVRLPGDVLIDLLDRHRTDVRRRSIIDHIAGPVCAWTCEHLGMAPAPRHAGIEPPGIPPALAVHPDAPLQKAANDPSAFAASLLAVLAADSFSAADRLLLEHALTRCAPSALPLAVEALASVTDHPRSGVAASMLAALGRERVAMLHSFEESR